MKKLKGKLPYIFLVFLFLVLIAVIVIPTSLFSVVKPFKCSVGDCVCVCDPTICTSCCSDADSCDCFCIPDDPSFHCIISGGGGGGWHPPNWY